MSINSEKAEAVLRHLPDLKADPAGFLAGSEFGDFYEALYDAGLIVEFDWEQWTDRAQEFVECPDLIRDADLDTLRRLLTTHVRNDRFCDGHLRSMVLSGHIVAILARLQALVEDSGEATFRVCIHRGTTQIGGTCIELACEGKRLVLDLGMPLDAASSEEVVMPAVPGLVSEDPSLLGIVISHPHQDHYGLASRVPEGTTFLMGAATERILVAAADFTPSGGSFGSMIHLMDREPIQLGPFTITPYLMDHSAYDAYAILVEAGGRRLFYTGDLRGHGRKGKLYERLLREPPADVDVLLMEGTTLTRTGSHKGCRWYGVPART
jgi:glyoxylase-like metal-dependent hydrolase (beta-lactamase superfamily II)